MSSVDAENECVGCCFRFEGVKCLPFEEDAIAWRTPELFSSIPSPTSKRSARAQGMGWSATTQITRMKYVDHNLRAVFVINFSVGSRVRTTIDFLREYGPKLRRRSE